VSKRPSSRRIHAIWLSLCAALTVLILWLALMPVSAAPAGFGWDKLNHAGAIGVATGLAYLSLKPRRWAAAIAFFYGTALGVLIEILQATLTTTRSAEFGDVVADVTGAGSACIVICMYRRITALKH
jgi:VanZ family protein